MKWVSLFRKKDLNDMLPAPESRGTGLRKVLKVRDLTAFGIAAIIGAGIFSTIGNAAAQGGPAVILLFIFTALACGFSALCYAEFASSIPIAGSAYTYTYYTFGEVIAWIIGWDLLLEYAIGNIAVAISWSAYFTNFINGIGIHFPEYLATDYFSAHKAYKAATRLLSEGNDLITLPTTIQYGYKAWISAPQAGPVKMIANVPGFAIVILITSVVFVGIQESRALNNIMVAVKLFVVVSVIIVGFFYVDPENWSPFEPTGIAGIFKGVSAVFFAYIGFDAISTTAEECDNPQKDLPKAIFYALIICTVLYVLIALVLTGMVKYTGLAVADPLAFVFEKIGLPWMSGVIAFTALVAMASVLLIFQIGQPRIWMSMSRDGLLPPVFSKIHPRFKTPSFSTVLTGLVVALPTLFLNLTTVTDLTSIGTLFAFVIVCAGVLLLREDLFSKGHQRYRVPYVNGKYIVPASLLSLVVLLAITSPLPTLSASWREMLTYLVFVLTAAAIGIFSYLRNLSLIPVLGLLSCLFLMTQLGYVNWLRFLIWLVLGLVIYFVYGRKNSMLNKKL